MPIGRCEASGPAVSTYQGGTVFETFLNRPVTAGRVLRTRPVDWSSRSRPGRRTLSAGSATSAPPRRRRPLSVQRLYIGTAEGNVYCLRASDGKTLWSYHVGGPVKGAIAYDRGKVFFGSYDGNLYALTAATGKLVWSRRARPATSTRRRPSHTHASTSARPTTASTPSTSAPADSSGLARPARTSTARPQSGADASSSARTTMSSTPSTRRRETSTGRSRPPGRSPARRRSSAGSSTSPTSALSATRHTYALDVRTGREVWSVE